MTSLRFSPSHSSSAVATQNLQLISKAIEEDESSKTSKLTSSKVPSSSSTVSSLKQHDIVQLHKQAPHNQSLYLISKAIEQEESAIRKHSISKVPSSSCEASLIKEYNNDQQQQSLPITATATTTTKEDWCSNNSSSQHQHQMVAMPAGFVPSPYDVLCGRGRVCKSAAGNMAYRDAILRSLDEYAAAENKLSKGNIITEIMDSVRKKCHDYHGKNPNVGGFVKCVNGAWFEVGDFLAREKTSQCFRDALATHYSSSAQSKYLRRRAKEHPDYFPFDSTESGFSRKNSLSSSTGESSAAGIATMNEVRTIVLHALQRSFVHSNDEK